MRVWRAESMHILGGGCPRIRSANVKLQQPKEHYPDHMQRKPLKEISCSQYFPPVLSPVPPNPNPSSIRLLPSPPTSNPNSHPNLSSSSPPRTYTCTRTCPCFKTGRPENILIRASDPNPCSGASPVEAKGHPQAATALSTICSTKKPRITGSLPAAARLPYHAEVRKRLLSHTPLRKPVGAKSATREVASAFPFSTKK